MNKKRIGKRNSLLSLFCVFIVLFTGCTAAKKEQNQSFTDNMIQEPVTKSSIKLNTAISITLHDSTDTSIIDSCFDLCDYYEKLLSRTIPTSEISKINSSKSLPVTVSKDTLSVIKKGLEYSKLSNGLFDITIAPLTSLWNFGAVTPKRPSNQQIADAITRIGYENVRIESDTITFTKENMGFDLGAIAKGYIADRLKEHLLSKGVKSAVISLGGNVLCVGEKPNGASFNVGVQKPFADRSETSAIMQLKDVSIVSSGIYERFFTEDGITYHHILDPFTGFPIDNDLISVTIISPYSVDGDALSTISFALGLDKGLEFINSIPDTHAIFITSDYELHYTDGFFDTITMLED